MATPSPRAHPPSALAMAPVRVTPMPQNAPARPVTGPLPYPAPLEASMSMPIVARRPWALIVIVLLIDLGLAATGVWLLTQGLGDRSAAPHPSASKSP